MIPLLQECRAKYPSLPLYLRGDSGFASPDLYKACEDNYCNFVVTTMESEPLIFLYDIYKYIYKYLILNILGIVCIIAVNSWQIRIL